MRHRDACTTALLFIKRVGVVREFEIVERVRHLQLFPKRLRIHSNAHRTEFVTAVRDVIPDQDVAVEAVSVAVGFVAGVGDPVIVIGGSHLVGVLVFQGPTDSDNQR